MQGPSRPREAAVLTRERMFLTGPRQGSHCGPCEPHPSQGERGMPGCKAYFNH